MVLVCACMWYVRVHVYVYVHVYVHVDVCECVCACPCVCVIMCLSRGNEKEKTLKQACFQGYPESAVYVQMPIGSQVKGVRWVDEEMWLEYELADSAF